MVEGGQGGSPRSHKLEIQLLPGLGTSQHPLAQGP